MTVYRVEDVLKGRIEDDEASVKYAQEMFDDALSIMIRKANELDERKKQLKQRQEDLKFVEGARPKAIS